MANVVLQQGDLEFLETVRSAATVLTSLKLFQNNHVPAVTDVNANYTEATFSGYLAMALGVWNLAFINPSGKGEIDANPQAFSHNGGGVANSIYGVYVVDATGNVMYAERFPAPVLMAALGDSITYTPRLTCQSA